MVFRPRNLKAKASMAIHGELPSGGVAGVIDDVLVDNDEEVRSCALFAEFEGRLNAFMCIQSGAAALAEKAAKREEEYKRKREKRLKAGNKHRD